MHTQNNLDNHASLAVKTIKQSCSLALCIAINLNCSCGGPDVTSFTHTLWEIWNERGGGQLAEWEYGECHLKGNLYHFSQESMCVKSVTSGPSYVLNFPSDALSCFCTWQVVNSVWQFSPKNLYWGFSGGKHCFQCDQRGRTGEPLNNHYEVITTWHLTY